MCQLCGGHCLATFASFIARAALFQPPAPPRLRLKRGIGDMAEQRPSPCDFSAQVVSSRPRVALSEDVSHFRPRHAFFRNRVTLAEILSSADANPVLCPSRMSVWVLVGSMLKAGMPDRVRAASTVVIIFVRCAACVEQSSSRCSVLSTGPSSHSRQFPWPGGSFSSLATRAIVGRQPNLHMSFKRVPTGSARPSRYGSMTWAPRRPTSPLCAAKAGSTLSQFLIRAYLATASPDIFVKRERSASSSALSTAS